MINESRYICSNTVEMYSNLDRTPSQDCQCIWRTGNTTMNVKRCAGKEKAVFIFLLASLCQLLEVPELADRCSPHGEEVIVESCNYQPSPRNICWKRGNIR